MLLFMSFLHTSPNCLPVQSSSVQSSRSVVSDSLRPHGPQHARPPCPSPTARVYSNSCPLSQWCHPTISSSVIPFSSHLQSFPASRSFQISLFKSVLYIRWPSIGFQLQHQSFQWIFRTDLLYDGLAGSPCSPRDSQESSPTPQFKTSILWCSAFFIVQLSATPWSAACRLPCPPLSPGVGSSSCPLSQWCYVTISSSAILFSFCLQYFPVSGPFPMSQLFPSGGQSTGASASVLLMSIQNWFPLELTGSISLQSKGLSRVFFSATVRRHQFFGAQPSLWSNSPICTWLLGRP